ARPLSCSPPLGGRGGDPVRVRSTPCPGPSGPPPRPPQARCIPRGRSVAEHTSNRVPSPIQGAALQYPRARPGRALGLLLLILVVWIAMQTIRIAHWLGGGRPRGAVPN